MYFRGETRRWKCGMDLFPAQILIGAFGFSLSSRSLPKKFTLLLILNDGRKTDNHGYLVSHHYLSFAKVQPAWLCWLDLWIHVCLRSCFIQNPHLIFCLTKVWSGYWPAHVGGEVPCGALHKSSEVLQQIDQVPKAIDGSVPMLTTDFCALDRLRLAILSESLCLLGVLWNRNDICVAMACCLGLWQKHSMKGFSSFFGQHVAVTRRMTGNKSNDDKCKRKWVPSLLFIWVAAIC